ncbi:MAG: SMC-Scp complex subunit ScpB, partial [Candidatus Peribacteraceae bacterium]|nr:SMC-Scp complex subunit ScpB [Candidatus Peribacteraceae bacterium]
PKKVIEAALFMSPKPITSKEIAKMTGFPERHVEERLEELRTDYENDCKGVEITRDPEGWGMRVKPGILPQVAHLTPYSDLKEGHKRTLALVAYKEPIKQSKVIKIQGNKAYAYIKRLSKKGLIKSHKEGRTKILTLTKEFERYFGEEKQRIKELLSNGVNEMEEEEKIRVDKERQKQLESFEKSRETQEEEHDRIENELKQEKPVTEEETEGQNESVEEKIEEHTEEKEVSLADKIKRMENKLKGKKTDDEDDDDEKSYSDLDKVIPFSND